MWVHKESGTVFPTAPGTLAGEFDENLYEFKNAEFGEIINDFNEFQNVLRKIRRDKPFRVLLTVSPVPLTATASGKHVLNSNMYSKSILRAVAGQLHEKRENIDYFPSYEIVTNPRMHSTAFSDNLRSVRDEAIQTVMNHFFSEHPVIERETHNSSKNKLQDKINNDIQCEESLIEAFGK